MVARFGLSLALIALFASTASAQAALITSVNYPDTVKLGRLAVLEVTLEDISDAGAPAVIASRRVPQPGTGPILLSVPYDAGRVLPARHYAIRAQIVEGANKIFESARPVRVLTQGTGSVASISLIQPEPTPAAEGNAPASKPEPEVKRAAAPRSDAPPVPKPESARKPEPAPKPEAAPKPKPEPVAKPSAAPKTGAPKSETESKPAPTPKPVSSPKPTPTPAPKVEALAEKVESKPAGAPKPAADPKPVATESKPPAPPKSAPEPKAVPGPKAVPEPKRESAPKSAPAANVVPAPPGPATVDRSTGSGAAALAVLEWTMTDIGKKPVRPATKTHRKIVLSFDEERGIFTGTSGCNDLSGRFHAAGGKLTMTSDKPLKICRIDQMTERAVRGMIEDTRAYRISGTTLELLDQDGNRLAKFVR